MRRFTAIPMLLRRPLLPGRCSSYGELVEAAVRVRPGSSLDPLQLKQLCVAKLGEFKSPERIHFLDELPKGPSGKIQRLKLAALTRDA